MTITLFDDSARDSLLPLTFTRPVARLRVGILTIAEKWAKRLDSDVAFLTVAYLQEKFPYHHDPVSLFINGSVCPDEYLVEAISKLETGEALYASDLLLAARGATAESGIPVIDLEGFKLISYARDFSRIMHPEHIFMQNEEEILRDFELVTSGRTSASLSSTNTVLGDQIFVEEGVEAECSTFNTLKGPIYLGRNSGVWEGSMVRGAFALCEGAQLKMGTRIYSKTTIGPYCRIGGEINNAVIMGYSSKGHDGYLGNSVIGEWCNLGADTNNSNLKNNYASVKLWDYANDRYRDTGLQFCGLIMGDHSKCSVNTMFNTGTVVGVSSNVFGAGFPQHFVPDFSWYEIGNNAEYRLDKAIETTERVFARREKELDTVERGIFAAIFDLTKHYRNIKTKL
ncbi:UDP-N-acetylglucosamine diphosphorylase/glucosamine-1-phosphate N-acetyltransferase [Arcticibacter pallidicorallinus]|uniref:UDP-N-acetylglucosamine diphosphorylase/glucosamine-1-phosphate N-acetyltransferase n=1 Tax=Arcticibacter pallidicorallinus TaxID=1259464 RepID=A0A2T0U5D5_9SPHI|nr:putative sugar nucleotidyl transferase [Arcticibacter pallidicorallinus]PRY53136.1 UDP-N-acetylglucosamine diphosphorylase/glucosamine-1-phosphate N-acetyltransferase [Arcticibacter pallidicorallinus]